MKQGTNFTVNRTIIIDFTSFCLDLLPRLHQVCGKMLFSPTDGIVMENVILFNFTWETWGGGVFQGRQHH